MRRSTLGLLLIAAVPAVSASAAIWNNPIAASLACAPAFDDDKTPAKPKESPADPFAQGTRWKGTAASLIRNNNSRQPCTVTVQETPPGAVVLRIRRDDKSTWDVTCKRAGSKLTVTEINAVGEKGVSLRESSGSGEVVGNTLKLQMNTNRFGKKIKNQPIQDAIEATLDTSAPDSNADRKKHHKKRG